MPPPPLDVSYTVSGTSGSWDLDFTVANNIESAPNQGFYFFGVLTDSADVTGSPLSFDAPIFAPIGDFNPLPYGGPNITYNDVWITDNDFSFTPGTVASGFDVHLTDPVAPTSVDWFAFTFDPTNTSPYTGGGNFLTDGNPGFAGVVNGGSSVPDAGSSLALFGMGLSAVAMLRRRFGKA